MAQCNNTAWPAASCCLPKSTCTSLVPKSGDTAWSAGRPGVSGDTCTLLSLSPAVEQFLVAGDVGAGVGLRTGIKGHWDALGDNAGITLNRANSYDASPGAAWQDPAAAVADFTLLSADTAVGAPGVVSTTLASSDLGALWADFAVDGSLSGNTAGGSTMASYGAVAASAQLLPNETRAITLVFSWRLPYRLYVGQELGNAYAQHFISSEEAARSVATRLPDVIAGGSQWNAACTNNTLPPWMQVEGERAGVLV